MGASIDSVFGEASLLGLKIATSSLGPHMAFSRCMHIGKEGAKVRSSMSLLTWH